MADETEELQKWPLPEKYYNPNLLPMELAKEMDKILFCEDANKEEAFKIMVSMECNTSFKQTFTLTEKNRSISLHNCDAYFDFSSTYPGVSISIGHNIVDYCTSDVKNEQLDYETNNVFIKSSPLIKCCLCFHEITLSTYNFPENKSEVQVTVTGVFFVNPLRLEMIKKSVFYPNFIDDYSIFIKSWGMVGKFEIDKYTRLCIKDNFNEKNLKSCFPLGIIKNFGVANTYFVFDIEMVGNKTENVSIIKNHHGYDFFVKRDDIQHIMYSTDNKCKKYQINYGGWYHHSDKNVKFNEHDWLHLNGMYLLGCKRIIENQSYVYYLSFSNNYVVTISKEDSIITIRDNREKRTLIERDTPIDRFNKKLNNNICN